MVVVRVVCCDGVMDVLSWVTSDGGGFGHSGSVQFSAGTFLVTSDTWCVSAACLDTVVSTKSIRSKRNNPFPVS